MNRTLLAGLAGLTLALSGAAAADAATVNVRVEGQNATLLPRTAVEQPTTAEPQSGCAGNTAASALDVATKGNWDHQKLINTILGETHDYTTNNDSWQVWVFRGGVYVSTQVGACDEVLTAGEDVLFAYEVSDADYNPTIFPTWITGVPATAAPGQAVTVTVKRTVCNPADYCATATAAPVEGATVTGGTAPVTTDAQGQAIVTLGARGAAGLRATKTGLNPSATEPTCVTDGADGYCGTRASDGTTLPPAQGGTPAVTPVKDTAAPSGAIAGIKDKQTFSRKKAPRRLRASVTDASGLLQVKIALTRKVGKRCFAFSGKREAFKRVRCGTHPVFKVGDKADVDYLLPKRLGKGRYTFDVLATDTAYNRDQLARGRNRVVFTVR